MQFQNGFFALSAIPALLINNPLIGVISHPPKPLIVQRTINLLPLSTSTPQSPLRILPPSSPSCFIPIKVSPLQIGFVCKLDTPRARVVAEVAVGYATAGQYDVAVQMAQTIDYNYLQAATLVKIAHQSVKAKLADRAIQILSQAMLIAQTIEHKPNRAKVLADIAVEYAATGQSNQARTIVQSLADQDFKSNVIVKIVRQYAATREFEQAIQFAQLLPDSSPEKELALADIVVQLIAAGQDNKAFQVVQALQDGCAKDRTLKYSIDQLSKMKPYELAQQLARSIQSDNFRTEALANLLVQYAAKAQADQALPLLSEALNITQTLYKESLKAELLGQIAVQYAAIGQADKANQLLSQALETLQNKSVRDADWRIEFREVALVSSQYATAGQTEKAEELLSQAIKMAQSETQSDENKPLDAIAKIFADVRLFSQAIQIAETLKDSEFRSPVLTEIANKLTEVGRYDEALQVARMIDLDANKVTTMVQLANQYFVDGKLNRASDVLDEVLKSVERKEDSEWKATGLAQIAGQYAVVGQTDKALEILTQSLETIEKAMQRIVKTTSNPPVISIEIPPLPPKN
jgi:tetratricopeptide (TPR) repeat protein